MAASIVFIVTGLAFGLFAVHRDRLANAEAAAALHQSSSAGKSLVTVSDPQKREEAPAAASVRETTEHAARRAH